MEEKHLEPRGAKAVADTVLENAASELRNILKVLAGKLHPFPPFMNMVSIQAVEVEPSGVQSSDRGCVVVCPDGELYELSLRLIQGPPSISDVDQVEEFEPLNLQPEEYIPYACAAIVALARRFESISPPS